MQNRHAPVNTSPPLKWSDHRGSNPSPRLGKPRCHQQHFGRSKNYADVLPLNYSRGVTPASRIRTDAFRSSDASPRASTGSRGGIRTHISPLNRRPLYQSSHPRTYSIVALASSIPLSLPLPITRAPGHPTTNFWSEPEESNLAHPPYQDGAHDQSAWLGKSGGPLCYREAASRSTSAST